MFLGLFGQKKALGDIDFGAHAPAAATAAVVTLAAVAQSRRLVHKVYWSFSEAPASGAKITITGGDATFEVAITAAGPGGFSLGPYVGAVNTQVVVTLASGG